MQDKEETIRGCDSSQPLKMAAFSRSGIMKKAYTVIYQGESVSALKQKLETISSFRQIGSSPKHTVFIVVPSNPSIDARKLRDELRSVLNPFEDALMVYRIATNDYSHTDNWEENILEKAAVSTEVEIKNFQRFENLLEASDMYEREKPRWVNPDGVGLSTAVTFEDWCWLPVRQNGIYEKDGRFNKYLY